MPVRSHHRNEFNAAHCSLFDMSPNHISQWQGAVFFFRLGTSPPSQALWYLVLAKLSRGFD
jgi:hypothetical protein